MTRRQNWTPAPRPLWALLFCAHLVSQVARGTPAPQATVVASASARMAKDPCSLQPPALLRAKGCPGLEVTWPEEEVPLNGTLTLSCTACSRFPHFSILYWLGNGSFIERLPGRLREGSIRRERRGAGTQLRRALVLEQLSPGLRHANFSCVFSDPGQTAQRHLVLAQLWVRKPRGRRGGERGLRPQQLRLRRLLSVSPSRCLAGNEKEQDSAAQGGGGPPASALIPVCFPPPGWAEDKCAPC
uniref:Interleukin-18-binding protein n=1 Tax=Sus scrofa TaxID=9823 RepID=A0A8D1LTI3_PIG